MRKDCISQFKGLTFDQQVLKRISQSEIIFNSNHIMEEIRKQIKESIRTKQEMLGDDNLIITIMKAAEVIINAIKNGKKLMIAGNGGSAADAQHIAGELVNRFMFDRPGIPAVALTTDTSVITSIANDYNYELIFARQVETIGTEDDVIFLISTSGGSANIIKAANAARKKKITVIGLTGKSGGKLKDFCDLLITVPSDETPRIQECHLLINHLICYLIEKELFKH